MSLASFVGIYTFVQGNIGFAIVFWARRGVSSGVVPILLSGDTLFMGRHPGLVTFQVLHVCPDLTLAKCVWWWMMCGPVCGSSIGTLFVGNHWNIILSFTIIGKRVWVGFWPCVLRNGLALQCIWVSIHWVWIYFELWIPWFLWTFLLRDVCCAHFCYALWIFCCLWHWMYYILGVVGLVRNPYYLCYW